MSKWLQKTKKNHFKIMGWIEANFSRLDETNSPFLRKSKIIGSTPTPLQKFEIHTQRDQN